MSRVSCPSAEVVEAAGFSVVVLQRAGIQEALRLLEIADA
jgi:hypothetical protein